jgi:hypothetical protein
LKARIASGYTRRFTGFTLPENMEKQILPYSLNAKVQIPVPAEALRWAKQYRHDGPSICILPAGSAGFQRSPSIAMWVKICKALLENIPSLKIYFTGVLEVSKGRTITEDFSKKDLDVLLKKVPGSKAAFDIGLWNQLALIKKCDIFLSPHTGFAFLAPTVGTPWLAISNCPWQEYLFNDVKFYSVLPSCGYYPSQENTTDGCGKRLNEDKKMICSEDKQVERKIPEIIKGTKLLLDDNFTYKKAIDLHLEKIKQAKDVDQDAFFFLDGIEGITRTS